MYVEYSRIEPIIRPLLSPFPSRKIRSTYWGDKAATKLQKALSYLEIGSATLIFIPGSAIRLLPRIIPEVFIVFPRFISRPVNNRIKWPMVPINESRVPGQHAPISSQKEKRTLSINQDPAALYRARE